MSISLTASQVLFARVDWQVLLIVALCTHSIYSVDNLVDWAREKHLLRKIQPYRQSYVVWCTVTLPLSMVLVLVLALLHGGAFVLTLAAIGLFCTLIMLVARRPRLWLSKGISYWVERLLVALTWALFTVLVPMQYAGRTINLQVILAIVFIWMISWALGIVWRLASIVAVQLSEGRPEPTLAHKRTIHVAIAASFLAFLQAVLDTAVGFFPYLHLSVALLPALCVAFLVKWHLVFDTPLLYCNLLYAVLILTLFLIAGLHTWAG
jgi:hypothetical protein